MTVLPGFDFTPENADNHEQEWTRLVDTLCELLKQAHVIIPDTPELIAQRNRYAELTGHLITPGQTAFDSEQRQIWLHIETLGFDEELECTRTGWDLYFHQGNRRGETIAVPFSQPEHTIAWYRAAISALETA